MSHRGNLPDRFRDLIAGGIDKATKTAVVDLTEATKDQLDSPATSNGRPSMIEQHPHDALDLSARHRIDGAESLDEPASVDRAEQLALDVADLA